VLTIISCCIIISIYILNKDRSYGFGLIVILCFSNMGIDIIFIIDIIRFNVTNQKMVDNYFCAITGAIKDMFIDASYVCLILISRSLY
jgi:hypothetical protein